MKLKQNKKKNNLNQYKDILDNESLSEVDENGSSSTNSDNEIKLIKLIKETKNAVFDKKEKNFKLGKKLEEREI